MTLPDFLGLFFRYVCKPGQNSSLTVIACSERVARAFDAAIVSLPIACTARISEYRAKKFALDWIAAGIFDASTAALSHKTCFRHLPEKWRQRFGPPVGYILFGRIPSTRLANNSAGIRNCHAPSPALLQRGRVGGPAGGRPRFLLAHKCWC